MVQSVVFGAAVPLAVVRLQRALIALGKRKGDVSLASIRADGLVGQQTTAATNRALSVYVVQGVGPVPPSWRNMTSSAIKANANEIAPYIERAAGVAPPAPVNDNATFVQASMFPSPAQAAVDAGTAASVASRSVTPTPGGPMPAYYPPPQAAYYSPPPQYPYGPQGYGPPRGPGGLPADRASLDVKAFIPAQYEHVRIHPGIGMAIVLTGVVVALMVARDKKKHEK